MGGIMLLLTLVAGAISGTNHIVENTEARKRGINHDIENKRKNKVQYHTYWDWKGQQRDIVTNQRLYTTMRDGNNVLVDEKTGNVIRNLTKEQYNLDIQKAIEECLNLNEKIYPVNSQSFYSQPLDRNNKRTKNRTDSKKVYQGRLWIYLSSIPVYVRCGFVPNYDYICKRKEYLSNVKEEIEKSKAEREELQGFFDKYYLKKINSSKEEKEFEEIIDRINNLDSKIIHLQIELDEGIYGLETKQEKSYFINFVLDEKNRIIDTLGNFNQDGKYVENFSKEGEYIHENKRKTIDVKKAHIDRFIKEFNEGKIGIYGKM